MISETVQEQNSRYRELVRTTIAGSIIELWHDLAFKGKTLYYSLETIKDQAIRDFYEEALTGLDLGVKIPWAYTDYLAFGRFVIQFIDDVTKGYYTDCIIHDLDYVEIACSPISGIVVALQPTEEQQRWASSVDPGVVEQRAQVDPEVVECFVAGTPVILDRARMRYMFRGEPPLGVSLLGGLAPDTHPAKILQRMRVDVRSLRDEELFRQKFSYCAAALREQITDRVLRSFVLPKLADYHQYYDSCSDLIVPVAMWVDEELVDHRAIVLRVLERSGISLEEIERMQAKRM